MNVKNTARLAVCAGLCASMTLGGLPLPAIAAEIEGAKSGQSQKIDERLVEQSMPELSGDAEEGGSPDKGTADAEVGDAAPTSDGASEAAGAASAASDADPAGGDSAKPAPSGAKADDGKVTSLVGKGVVEEPYQVSSAEDLKFVAEKVNNGDAAFSKACYKLTANIDLSGVEWAPIGASAHKFAGTFNGAGHTISNLAVNNTELEGAGLFGWLDGGRISGIKLNNAAVTAKSSAGALVGVAHTGAISDCHVAGAVKITAHYKVGGLAGGGYADIANCSVKATGDSFVTGVYNGNDLEGDNVGGLVGFRGEGATATTGCSVSGLKVSGTRKVGGLIGSAFADNKTQGCSVSNVELACNAPYSYASGALVKNQLCVGGLIGIFHKSGSNGGTMKDCSVSNISMSVTVPEVAKEGWPILGLVSGGYRASSLSGASAPDGQVNIEGLKVEGTNTGSNAEEKFPGSVAMNGTSSVFEKGSGTAEDPHIISSVDDLKLLQKSVNTTGVTYEGQHLKLANGVEFDLSGAKWASIGTSGHKFMGAFDGNGATIKGLTDLGERGTYGLFGHISGATIKNMKFVDVKLDHNGSNRGAVAGCLYGANTIENIEVSGSIAGLDYVGGVAGRPYLNADNPGTLTIKNCVNNATITSNGVAGTKIGGIVGYARADVAGSTLSVVEGCVNNGAVSGAQYAGGIAGWAYNAELKGCTNTAKVSGSTSAGGIVGNTNTNVKIDLCKNSGEIVVEGEAAKESGAGGIIGVSNSGGAIVTKSANTGSITGVKSAAGIIGGTAAAGDTVVNCYNGGDVTATAAGAIAAGIYGYNNSTSPVKACFNDGAVKADNGTVYQIGKSTYWYEPAPGSQNASCFYKNGDKIFAAAANGTDAGVEQKGMTRDGLAGALNTAGQVDAFWQAQNGSVQPDPLISGAWDGEDAGTKAIVEVLDVKGNVVERYESVSAAFAAAKDGQTIKLVKDADISGGVNPVELPAGVKVTLDLAGNQLKVANTKTGSIVVKGDLTLVDSSDTKKDGTGTGRVYTETPYTGADTGYGMIRVAGGGSFTMKSGLVDAASFTKDHVNKGQFAIVLDNATGDASITVNGGKVLAGWYAVSGNGNNKTHEGRITVNGGALISVVDYAIYSPQAGGVTITGGTVSGACGAVHIQRGELVVSGGELISEGTGTTGTWGDGTSGSGNATVNFAGKYGSVDAEITGGSFIANKGAEMFHKGTTNQVNALVSGGSFSEMVPEDMLAGGFGNNLEKGEDGLYHVHKHDWAGKFESNEKGHWHACTKCDETSEVALHTEKTVGAKPATCGEDGYTGDTVCADCGYVIEKGAVIPATGKHTAGDAWKSDGTSHWHECTGCGIKLDEAEHASSKWVANDTDHWRLCDECGAAFEVSAHDFGDWKVTKEPTASAEGVREHACKACGKVVSEAVPALGSAPQGGKPSKDDKLAQTGDTSMLGMAAAGIAGISSALAGIFTARKRRDDE